MVFKMLEVGFGMDTWRVSLPTSQWMPKALGAWHGGVIETGQGSVSSKWGGIMDLRSLELVLHLRRTIPAWASRLQSSALSPSAFSTFLAPDKTSSM